MIGPTRRWLVVLAAIVAIGAAGCSSDEPTIGSDAPSVPAESASGSELEGNDPERASEQPGSAQAPAPPLEPAPPVESAQGTRALRAPVDYSEVGAEYAVALRATRASGREVVDTLLAADGAAAYAHFGEELRGRLSERELRALLEELRRDRVHFEDSDGELKVAFDGVLSDDTMSGSFALDQALGTFLLEHSSAASVEPAAPLVRRWEGTVALEGTQVRFSVAFELAGEQLTGTIDVPEQGLSGLALENVRYEPSVQSGELLAESVLPLGPDRLTYTSERIWGPSTLVLTLVFDGSGTVTDFVEPSWRSSLPPDAASDHTSEVEFRLPFDGVWWVSWGGATQLENFHVTTPSQRHALDFVIWKQGGTHRGDGTRNEDYWAWEQPVLAPADGTIVAVLDGLEDNTPGVLDPQPHPAGNHVVLKPDADSSDVGLRPGTDEFLFLAHFRQGSIQVELGERVKEGSVLGLTGNSGNSTEPHIHIHLQDEPSFSPTAIGLPFAFSDYLVNGEPISEGRPVQGQLIQRAGE